MKFQQLDHVAIHVADVQKSVEFYARVLRLEPMPRPAFDFPGAWFRLGATQELHIVGERKEPVISQSRGNHYALLVDDIEAWEAHLKSEGATYRPPKLRPDGATQIFLADPDGHTIELCTRPPK